MTPGPVRQAADADHGLIVQVVSVEPPQGTVALLHAFTLPGDPVRVAVEPRMAADIAERLEADGQPCYAVVEPWQIIGAEAAP